MSSASAEPAPESLIGTRVKLNTNRLPGTADVRSSPPSSPSVPVIEGVVEAYSPETDRHLVVFDTRFDLLEGDENEEAERARDKFVKSSSLYVRIADWDLRSNTLLDKGETLEYLPWRACVRSTPRRPARPTLGLLRVTERSERWIGLWVKNLADGLQKKNLIREVGLHPGTDKDALLCFCRRFEDHEPPPPPLELRWKQHVYNEKLTNCDTCGEWYHWTCAVSAKAAVGDEARGRLRGKRAVKRLKLVDGNDAESWECLVCELRPPDSSRAQTSPRPAVSSMTMHQRLVQTTQAKCPDRWGPAGEKLLATQWWPARDAGSRGLGASKGEWIVALVTDRRLVARNVNVPLLKDPVSAFEALVAKKSSSAPSEPPFERVPARPDSPSAESTASERSVKVRVTTRVASPAPSTQVKTDEKIQVLKSTADTKPIGEADELSRARLATPPAAAETPLVLKSEPSVESGIHAPPAASSAFKPISSKPKAAPARTDPVVLDEARTAPEAAAEETTSPWDCARVSTVSNHLKEYARLRSAAISSSSGNASPTPVLPGGGPTWPLIAPLAQPLCEFSGEQEPLADPSVLNGGAPASNTNQETRQKRLRFGRSPIHNWGVYADEPIGATEFVVEYKGELIGNRATDKRERLYTRRGVQDYLFRVSPESVIDATVKGSIARFINHSCEPNCYSDVITFGGQKKICIYTLRAIKLGEELTYDYKFPNEPDNKLPCRCGAAKCRKWLNYTES